MNTVAWIVIATGVTTVLLACRTPGGVASGRPLYRRLLSRWLPPLCALGCGVAAYCWYAQRNEARRFEHFGQPLCVAFSDGGDRFVSGDGDGLVRLWETDTGREVRRYRGCEEAVSCVGLSRDGRYVLAGSRDGRVLMWEADRDGPPVAALRHPPARRQRDTVAELLGLEAPPAAASALAFLPDDKNRVLVAWLDHLGVYDLQTRQEVLAFEAPSWDVECLALSPKGDMVVTGPDLQVWDATTGRVMGGRPAGRPQGFQDRANQDLYFQFGKGLLCVAFTPDGLHFVSARHWEVTPRNGSAVRSDEVVLWDAHTLKEVRRFQADGSTISAVAVTADGRHVVAGSKTGTVAVWDRDTGERLPWYGSHLERSGRAAVTALATHPGQALALSASRNGAVSLWRLP